MTQASINGATSKEVGINDNTHDIVTAMTIPVIIIGIILSGVSLYMLIAVLLHRFKLRKATKKAEKLARGSIRIKKASSSPRLDNLSIIAASLTLLNCLSDHPVLFTTQTSNVACKVMQLCSFVFYASGVASLYTFLWFRQRACYKDPSLAQSHNKVCRVASAFILPVFLLMMVAGKNFPRLLCSPLNFVLRSVTFIFLVSLPWGYYCYCLSQSDSRVFISWVQQKSTADKTGMVLTGALWSFESSADGCVETSKTRTPLIVLFVGSITMQITLLALFIYPLKRHTSLFFEKSSSQRSATDKLLSALVKRSIIATGLCVLADLTAFLLAVALDYEIPFIVINFIYDANLICNLLCVIGSFADWRQRIGPCCAKAEHFNDKRNISYKYSSSAKTATTSTV